MYILAIDQGTTGSTSMIVDAKSLKSSQNQILNLDKYFPRLESLSITLMTFGSL